MPSPPVSADFVCSLIIAYNSGIVNYKAVTIWLQRGYNLVTKILHNDGSKATYEFVNNLNILDIE